MRSPMAEHAKQFYIINGFVILVTSSGTYVVPEAPETFFGAAPKWPPLVPLLCPLAHRTSWTNPQCGGLLAPAIRDRGLRSSPFKGTA